MLTEFSLRGEAADAPQVKEALAAAVADFDLPAGFLERLQVSLLNTWQKHRNRHGPGLTGPPVQVRLCVTGVPGPGLGWGYYVVEKFEGETRQHRVEVILYSEAQAEGDRPPP